MKQITIIKLLNKIAKGKKVPKRIRYNLMIKGYDVFEWNEDEQEYIDVDHPTERFSFPLHHLTDTVEIL